MKPPLLEMLVLYFAVIQSCHVTFQILKPSYIFAIKIHDNGIYWKSPIISQTEFYGHEAKCNCLC